MSEPEATPVGETPSGAPAAPAFDPGVIRGLQVFAPVGEAAADGLDEAGRKEAIVQTLAARASRFAEAVDDALTLASDGTIRWLGDPIGKLIVGAGSLEPGATLLADEALPPEGREAAERRLSLWIADPSAQGSRAADRARRRPGRARSGAPGRTQGFAGARGAGARARSRRRSRRSTRKRAAPCANSASASAPITSMSRRC